MLTFVDFDWKQTPFQRTDHAPLPAFPAKPDNFAAMVEIARKLSSDVPFVRVDLYNISEQIYFSEFTFSPGAGYGVFSPGEWERKLGDWLLLPPLRKIEEKNGL